MKFSQIVSALGDAVSASSLEREGNATQAQASIDIQGLAALPDATGSDLSYIEGPKFASHVATTAAGALVIPSDEKLQAAANERHIAWVSVEDPRLVFARAIALFYQPYRRSPGIHPTAFIDPAAKLGQNVAVGPNAVVHEGATIGDRTCIHAGAVVYPKGHYRHQHRPPRQLCHSRAGSNRL